MRLLFAPLVVALSIALSASGQNGRRSPKLVICGGGSLPDTVYQRFLELACPRPSLVVIPTASQRDFNVQEIQKLWASRGFEEVRLLHSNDRDVVKSNDFAKPVRKATAIWFGGGSQQRIADAYLNTDVEKEFHQLLQRGGVIGGTSAGAAIQSRVMIASGNSEPTISTGFDLLQGAILDQHFLKRNRIPRLLAAIRLHPRLIGFGIDEGTALIIHEGKGEVVGRSYVLRIESINGTLTIDAFSNGDEVPLPLPAGVPRGH